MAIELNASQKKILNILKIDEQYIIPEYQRPYSWEYEQCFQFYNDLMNSFINKEDYFIGNIIIAKSDSDEYELDVVDGQQRLTTIFLLIKVLSLFTKDELFINDFEKILGGINRNTRQYEYRIKTNVFETKDQEFLNEVLGYKNEKFQKLLKESTNKKGEFQENKSYNRFKQNILYFYYWINYFNSDLNNKLDDFIEFLLEKITLLPIELRGENKESANKKALTIFETINNRGMNLEDADIFKSRLYNKAKQVNESSKFIDSWATLKNDCDNLKIDIDDVFRYYAHIIRGKNNITGSETKLREFFTDKDYSPFNVKQYKEIMDDLFKIVEILEFIEQEKKHKSQLSKWIQLIDIYTNQYPKIVLVTFFFIYGIDIKDFKILESTVRYVYSLGSTTKVKFEIYTIINKICKNESIDNYYQKFTIKDFDYLGNLKYGYALLAFYVSKSFSIEKFYFDKIYTLNDKSNISLPSDINFDYVVNCLGNFVVLDIPKKNLPFTKKLEYFKQSNFFSDNDHDVLVRDKLLKQNLISFFNGKL